MTEQDYLTLKQAAKFTGKSERTMRRFVESIVKGESATAGADRFHILPTAKEKEEGSNEPWRIDLALLRMRFPEAEQERSEEVAKPSDDTIDRLLTIVEKQADTQAVTIEKQNERIDELTEKLGAANEKIEELEIKLLPSGLAPSEGVVGTPSASKPDSIGESDNSQVAEAVSKRDTRPWWRRIGRKPRALTSAN